MIKFRYILFAFLWLGISCHQVSKLKERKNKVASKLIFESPVNEQIIRIGENITLQIHDYDTIAPMDSVQFSIDGVHCGSIKRGNETLTMSTENAKSGTHTISALAYFSSGITEHQSIAVRFYPGTKPKIYTYQVVQTYPHDKKAYTQGLLFDDGQLVESTGIKRESSLRRVKYETGEVVNYYKLPDNVFGEGVASIDNKLVQISWLDQVAFVYDKQTLTLTSRLKFPYKEGWGLTGNGRNLIMSDGSSHLYFLEKENLSEIGRIEVCDNLGPVDELNELEYIDGEIWANIYNSDTIVRINPETGVILGKIDLNGLLSSSDRTIETNVLNGIAYDPETKRIWVTGKNWPKLFQITVKQKDQ